MDEDKVVAQPTTKNTIVNNLLEMCQRNPLVIHNFANDVMIIKGNTSRNGDTNGNE